MLPHDIRHSHYCYHYATILRRHGAAGHYAIGYAIITPRREANTLIRPRHYDYLPAYAIELPLRHAAEERAT